MKAIQINRFGGPEMLSLIELERPRIKDNQVLIRTRAAGINPIDWKTCSGGGASNMVGDLPFVPGWECAGEIVETGSQVSQFQEGDRVFGLLNFPHAASCFAEYVAADADQIAALPAHVSFTTGGGLALAGLTALQALQQGELESGDKVLIMAGAGGVGHLAIQLAGQMGAQVEATASLANHDWLKELGCDEVHDYQDIDLRSLPGRYDLIIDGVGAEQGIEALSLLADEGRLITLPSVTAGQIIEAAEAQQRRAESMRVKPDGEGLAYLAELLDKEQLHLKVAETFALEDACKAFHASMSGHVRGKLVLTLD